MSYLCFNTHLQPIARRPRGNSHSSHVLFVVRDLISSSIAARLICASVDAIACAYVSGSGAVVLVDTIAYTNCASSADDPSGFIPPYRAFMPDTILCDSLTAGKCDRTVGSSARVRSDDFACGCSVAFVCA